MIYLTATTHKMEVITTAAGTINCYAGSVDVSGGVVSIPAPTFASIATATTTTLVPTPGAGVTRNVKSFRVSNDHATVSQAVTVRVTDGTTPVPLETVTLAPGEAITYHESTGMRVLGSNGVERAAVGGLITTGFAGANPITANAADTYVGGFLVTNRIQAGSLIVWRLNISKTAAGIAAPIFTFRSGTAGAVGDTARVTLTSPFAQTAVIDTGTMLAWAIVRTHGASGVLSCGYQLGHALATTGLGAQPSYGQSGASSAFDTTANQIIGLSVNPGASGVWTIDSSGVASDLVA